jgi:glycerol kinase
MAARYILAIDQGTTSSRALLVGRDGRVVRQAQEPVGQILPRGGWVEHDAADIWRGVVACMNRAVDGDWNQVAALGITNQRETTVLWDRQTDRPVHNAIVWQDRRTADDCRRLDAHRSLIQERTGLVLDAYFSATKLRWLLDHVVGAREAADRGKLAFGTIDSWLVWNLTGGRSHVTDFTNASRTMLMDLERRQWDQDMLEMLAVPPGVLPEICGCAQIVGQTLPELTGGRALPIAGMAGDQQAALMGQRCWSAGQAKNTYGTGAFALMNVGGARPRSLHKLLATLACDGRGRPAYALEGSIFIAGAAVQWLRDELGIIASADECDGLARSLPDNGGVYFVPALVGLGAPHWRSDVRGAIFGLTRGTGRAHLVRAALEAMAYQTRQVVEAMAADSGVALTELAADGGASRNEWLMQFQADVLGVSVARTASAEMTALGAAMLAGLGAGFWDDLRALPCEGTTRIEPDRSAGAQETYRQWCAYLERLLA